MKSKWKYFFYFIHKEKEILKEDITRADNQGKINK